LSTAAADALGHPAHKRPLVSAKDALWLLYLYPLRYFARAMPVRLLPLARHSAMPLLQLLLSKPRKRVAQELAARFGPEVPAEQTRQIATRFIANAVHRLFDDLVLDRLLASGTLKPVELTGLEYLEAARKAGKGVMVVNGHFFATRLAKRYLAQIGYPMLSVRHPMPPDLQMGRLGERRLQRRYLDFLHGVIGEEVFTQDPECTLKIFRRLRSGGLVHIYIDAPFSREEFRVPFLGKRPRFPAGYLRLAHLSGCFVVPMLCLGNSSGLIIRFDEPLKLLPAAGAEEFISRNLPNLVRKLEAQIIEHPDAWDAWRIRL
jgi:KDO2-lipid IV(A) lauroyltransferase